jgi:hypothetical protein
MVGTKVVVIYLVKIVTVKKMATRVPAGESGGAPSLLELKQCLLLSYLQCSERGLVCSANWYKNHQ